jgi:hypothetical protein
MGARPIQLTNNAFQILRMGYLNFDRDHSSTDTRLADDLVPRLLGCGVDGPDGKFHQIKDDWILI